jgi:undecaprenyl-diphosphatase
VFKLVPGRQWLELDERLCIRFNQAITCNARPLDPFSFPSGHTLHAVAFTAIASAYYPQLS